MARIFLLPALFLLLIGTLCFIARSTGKADPEDIVVANQADIITRDPGQMTWSQDIRLAMGLFEGLIAYDPKTVEPRPGVAETWETSADGLTWTFHLRRNARWSNGDPVTSKDFLFAWKRALTPSSLCQYLSLYGVIKNATAYNDYLSDPAKNKPVAWEDVGIKAPDDYTVEMRLSGPCTYLLDLMAFPTFYPLNERAMKPFRQEDGDYNPKWTHPPDFVTNGAFKLAEFRFHEVHVMEPNPFYWDRAAVKAKRVRLVTIEDPKAAMLQLKSGSVDVLLFVPSEIAPDLLAEQAGGLRDDVHFSPVFGTYYYVFNCTRKPYDDARVRRALALTIDKAQIVEKVTRLNQLPITTLVPAGFIHGYQSPAGLPRNTDEARKLLAEAGYPGGKGFPPAELLFNNEAAMHGLVAQSVGQMWKQELGIEVKFKGVEVKEFRALKREDVNFDVGRAGWYGDYMDPVTWLDLFRSGDGNNDGKYSNPAYDKLLDQAKNEPDPAKRFGILKDAESILVEKDMPLIPLYQYSDGYMFDPGKIGGMDLNVRMLTQFKFIHRIGPGETP